MDHLKQKKDKLLNIEGIVMLLDKFGSEINNIDNNYKIKPHELMELNEKLESYFKFLNIVAATNKNLPGFIKYKIINLVEKRNRNWQESKVDMASRVKSLKEVHEEFEHEIKENSGNTTNNNNTNFQNKNKEPETITVKIKIIQGKKSNSK